ncbi:MAG: DNA repair protein RecO [Xanthobacteraceae bacterium]
MEWTDEGVVLGVRRHGENSAIVELLTRAHGRHLGLVRGGAGSRMRPLLQPGNTVSALWRARLDTHLGLYQIDGLRLRAAHAFGLPHGAYGITHLAALARLLPERDPHEEMFALVEYILDDFDDAVTAAAHVVRFELTLLTVLGFGLDLTRCVATGATHDLAYVSPKSGGAVSREAGAPWRERLLALPGFLGTPAGRVEVLSAADLSDGFRLTGLFLERRVLEPRGLRHSEAREGFIAAVLRQQARMAEP